MVWAYSILVIAEILEIGLSIMYIFGPEIMTTSSYVGLINATQLNGTAMDSPVWGLLITMVTKWG